MQLRKQLRTRLISQTNAERLRCKRWKKAKKRPTYVLNLGAQKSGKLESSQAEVTQYLRETHSDPLDMSTHDIKTCNTYLFRHFTPYFEHFQTIHSSFSTPISKDNQPIYRRCFIALIWKIFFFDVFATYMKVSC